MAKEGIHHPRKMVCRVLTLLFLHASSLIHSDSCGDCTSWNSLTHPSILRPDWTIAESMSLSTLSTANHCSSSTLMDLSTRRSVSSTNVRLLTPLVLRISHISLVFLTGLQNVHPLHRTPCRPLHPPSRPNRPWSNPFPPRRRTHDVSRNDIRRRSSPIRGGRTAARYTGGLQCRGKGTCCWDRYHKDGHGGDEEGE